MRDNNDTDARSPPRRPRPRRRPRSRAASKDAQRAIAAEERLVSALAKAAQYEGWHAEAVRQRDIAEARATAASVELDASREDSRTLRQAVFDVGEEKERLREKMEIEVREATHVAEATVLRARREATTETLRELSGLNESLRRQLGEQAAAHAAWVATLTTQRDHAQGECQRLAEDVRAAEARRVLDVRSMAGSVAERMTEVGVGGAVVGGLSLGGKVGGEETVETKVMGGEATMGGAADSAGFTGSLAKAAAAAAAGSSSAGGSRSAGGAATAAAASVMVSEMAALVASYGRERLGRIDETLGRLRGTVRRRGDGGYG